jgi:hypothetical protein
MGSRKHRYGPAALAHQRSAYPALGRIAALAALTLLCACGDDGPIGPEPNRAPHVNLDYIKTRGHEPGSGLLLCSAVDGQGLKSLSLSGPNVSEREDYASYTWGGGLQAQLRYLGVGSYRYVCRAEDPEGLTDEKDLTVTVVGEPATEPVQPDHHG